MDYRQNITQAASSQINAVSNGDTMSPGDIVNSRHLTLHDTLYSAAVEKMKAAMPDVFTKYKYVITEISNGAVNDAPSVSVSLYQESTAPPMRTVIPLSKWWADERIEGSDINTGSTKEPKCAEQSDFSNCECVYIDYVKSSAVIKDKITNKTRSVKLSDLYNGGTTVIPMSEKMGVLTSGEIFSTHYNSGVIL